MKKIVLLAGLAGQLMIVCSQNQVANYSFENVGISGDPVSWGGTYITLESQNGQVPTNSLGYQNPAHGDNYVAIQMYSPFPNPTQFTGSLIGELTDTIPAGSGFRISFKVSLCDESAFYSGPWYVYTSSLPIDPGTINTQVPDIIIQSVVQDTQNWTVLSGFDSLNKTVKHFAIYSFFNGDTVGTANNGGTFQVGSIYYVDWVCVPLNDDCNGSLNSSEPLGKIDYEVYRATDMLGRDVFFNAPGIQVRWYRDRSGRQFWRKQIVR